MKRGTILIVDDDKSLLRFLRLNLEDEGYKVAVAVDGYAAVNSLVVEIPDLVLLDVMLPGIDGFETCRRIRSMSDVPILMLTARGDQRDIVRGLNLGADDYMVKPFGAEELVARVQAVLRRTRFTEVQEKDEVFRNADMQIDFARHEVVVRGQPVRMRPTEYRLLVYFIGNANKVVSYDDLAARVWGSDYVGQNDLVRTYVRYLRQRVERDPAEPELIKTIFGVGYMFVSAPSSA